MTDTEKFQTLAQAVADAGARVGMYNGQVGLSGPQLLMILDDLAEQCERDGAALTAQAAEIAALKEEDARLRAGARYTADLCTQALADIKLKDAENAALKVGLEAERTRHFEGNRISSKEHAAQGMTAAQIEAAWEKFKPNLHCTPGSVHKFAFSAGLLAAAKWYTSASQQNHAINRGKAMAGAGQS